MATRFISEDEMKLEVFLKKTVRELFEITGGTDAMISIAESGDVYAEIMVDNDSDSCLMVEIKKDNRFVSKEYKDNDSR